MSNFYDDFVQDGSIDAFKENNAGSDYINQTGVYDVTIKKAYFESSDKSLSKTLVLEFESGDGRKLTTSEIVCNREGKTFYVNAKGEKNFLKGFNALKAMQYLLNDESEKLPSVSMRKLKLYNRFQKTEEIKDVNVIDGFLNKKITIAVIKSIKFGQIFNQETGKYENDESKYFNEYSVARYFDFNTKKTAKEKRDNYPIASSYDYFKNQFTSDYVKDETKGVWKELEAKKSGTSKPQDNSMQDPFGYDNPF